MSSHKGLDWRWGLAAGLLLAASPLVAQENTTASTPPTAAAAGDNIGPRELSNFSLNGTVTRPAERSPAVSPPATREPVNRVVAPSTASSDPSRAVVAETRPGSSARQAAVDPIAARPTLRRPPARAPATSATGATPALANPPTPLPVAAPIEFSPLPWIAALLLLGAGAVAYFGLQRRRHRHAAPGSSELAGQALAPQPSPPRPARQPAASSPVPRLPEAPPAPVGIVTSSLRAPAPPAGVVSSALRPWIELELEPSQAMVTDDHAAIAFDVTLFNSGSAPARDVAVEACLINAGQQQDVQLTQFYATPGEVRDKIPAVAPLSRVTLKSAVRLPRAAVQEYEVEGRKLFMPMVAVNSRYRWSSGEGQSAASFLVGRAANDRDKLGPLRLDQGVRGWKGLAARRYEKGIRR